MRTYAPRLFLPICSFILAIAMLIAPQAAYAQRQYIKPIPVTATQLATDYKNNFHAADAKYTGMLLLVTGKIKSVRAPNQTYNNQPNNLYSHVTMDTGANRPLVIYLLNWESQKITSNNYMRNGQQVTLMGFCQGSVAQLSLIDSCLYPDGCGGPDPKFSGPYFKLPPSPLPPLGK